MGNITRFQVLDTIQRLKTAFLKNVYLFPLWITLLTFNRETSARFYYMIHSSEGFLRVMYPTNRMCFLEKGIGVPIYDKLNINVVIMRINTEVLLQRFKAADKHKLKQLTAADLREVLVTENWLNFDLECCKSLVTLFDTNGNGTIGFGEFKKLYVFVEDWKEAFSRLNPSNSQFISVKDCTKLLTQLGYNVSKKTVGKVLESYCRHTRALEVKPDDFIYIYVKIRNISNVFKSNARRHRAYFDYNKFIQTVALLNSS